MEKIKDLFDSGKNIYRTIEKVITYNASQTERLKSEISEYVVTESIEEQFEKLLSKMQLAMDSGSGNEVGVWVSGFYGSGKSSFTKYLGLALDQNIQIEGLPFLEYLQDRLHKSQTKALLATVAKRFPAAVILLDLASEMVAGATMEDVSTVLYFKVLQWAGYSRNLKIAAFERKLKKEYKYEEFESKVKNAIGMDWKSVQNDPLVVDSIVPEIAHEMYPDIFKTPSSFSTETTDFIKFENERVQEMLDIVKETSGKEHIIFIVDEVGQYVGSRQNLILNLDGLAKNLKNIGDGKVWIIATAQQTLTEDDPRAAVNSPELYKLKDRFPIQMDLESKDIKEICYRRLLGKSVDGQNVLEGLFDKYGQALRHNTKLNDAKYYDSDFSKETFVNLYPFLPAHFDILLHLLAALAKSTGGIGLRSAIKVIQDILIEKENNNSPVAEKEIGWITSSVAIYDILEKDIDRAFPSTFKSVGKVAIRKPDSVLHNNIAKTIALLQILNNIPISAQNIASLLQDNINTSSNLETIQKAIEEMVSDPLIPLGEQEGHYRFISEKLNEIEGIRGTIPAKTLEIKKIASETLKELFSPLPSARLNGSLTQTAGLKYQTSGLPTSLDGDRNTIQYIVQFEETGNYEKAKADLITESTDRSSQNNIYIIGRKDAELDEKLLEIYRSNEICTRYKNDPDQEVKEYCSGQSDRAARLKEDLKTIYKRSLLKGSFVFRGQSTSVESTDATLLEACKKYLGDIVGQVFDRYFEAPQRVETSIAEKFLRVGNLNAITSNTDPMGLVQKVKGTPTIDTKHKAITSIKDFIDRHGNVEGKKLIDYFTSAPFGWSQDTIRYLIAAMLVAGEVKLKVSGREITVNGQQAIEALKNNNSFKPVGVSLRDERPSTDMLARAAERLTELSGEVIVPLEDDISKAAAKYLQPKSSVFASIGEKLSSLGINGKTRVMTITEKIDSLLLTDASDAPQTFGSEESDLYTDLKWVNNIEKAFNNGLEKTLNEIISYKNQILSLPDAGNPLALKETLESDFDALKDKLEREDFYNYTTDFNGLLTTIKTETANTVKQMAEGQKSRIKDVEADLKRIPEWKEFTQEEQSNTLAKIENLLIDVSEDINGLKRLVNQEFSIQSTSNELKKNIIEEGKKRKMLRLKEKSPDATKYSKSLKFPAKIKNIGQIDTTIRDLQDIKTEASIYSEIEVSINLEEEN
jgi:hypothetical protein